MIVMFLLDANVLICCFRDYYPLERIPEYWEWLAYQGDIEVIKVPAAIWDEAQEQEDDLAKWLRDHRASLLLAGENTDLRLPDVLAAYGDNLTEIELERLGADPFLIAAARELGATVVTKEGSKPRARRANRRIPDICREFAVQCISDHEMIRQLDFRTSWRRP
jgi:hypothetical protein